MSEGTRHETRQREKGTKVTNTISVPAGKLRLMLTAVLPHANEDDSLPALCSVSFEVRDGTLYLAATDRYTIAIAREPIPGAVAAGLPDQSALLPLEAAWDLRRMLKKRTDVAAVMIEDGKLAVECGRTSASWTTLDKGTFPDWRSLLHDSLTGTQAPLGDKAGVDAEKLARLTVLANRSFESLSIRFLVTAERKDRENPVPMLLATMGDWFLAAVMPVRLGGEDRASQWAEWTALTAPAEKAEKAEKAEDAAPAESDAEVPGE
jgi:hypothetical protein